MSLCDFFEQVFIIAVKFIYNIRYGFWVFIFYYQCKNDRSELLMENQTSSNRKHNIFINYFDKSVRRTKYLKSLSGS